MKRLDWIFPLGVVLLGAGMLLAAMRMPRDGAEEMQLRQAGRSPVIHNGRIKPLDTLARTSLLILSGRGEEYADLKGRKQPAIRWLLEVMCKDQGSDDPDVRKLEVFRVENDQVLGMLRMTPRSGFRYSLEEVLRGTKDKRQAADPDAESNYERLKNRANAARAKRKSERDLVDMKVLELEEKLGIYSQLSNHQIPHVVPPSRSGEGWQTLTDARNKARRDHGRQLVARMEAAAAAGRTAEVTALEAQLRKMMHPAAERAESWTENLTGDAKQFASILESYADGRAGSFNSAVEKHLTNTEALVRRQPVLGALGKVWLLSITLAASLAAFACFQNGRKRMAAWAGAVSLVAVTLALLGSVPWNVANVEVFFNQFAPFYRCLILYVVAFLLVVAGWLAFLFGASKPFWRAAYWLTVLTFVVHTLAIMARIYIQERPPVTNLYSSAIFIGWVAVLLAIALEPIMRLGVVTAVGALAGFLTLIVAHHLGNDGDTMEMLQAVLDTNFWLATHVTTVTMGYAATFLAATLGVAYIYMGVFSPILKKDVNSILESIGARRLRVEMNVGKLLSTILYGVICGAMLLSFVGTVLGGIWADQSWGRFWGWDPKENGAVLIVIWNALILHARWGGMIGQRGMAMLATFGGVVTAWSWFGTNMLGVGLHSYGFIPSAVFWLVFYIVVQLVTIGIGWIPERYWLSHSDRSNMPARSGPLREEPVEAIIVG